MSEPIDPELDDILNAKDGNYPVILSTLTLRELRAIDRTLDLAMKLWPKPEDPWYSGKPAELAPIIEEASKKVKQKIEEIRG